MTSRGLLALIFLFLVRLSSFFDMMVQMCASFRDQGIKPELFLLPPVLLPPSLLLELHSPFKDDLFNLAGCLKPRLLQHKTLIVD